MEILLWLMIGITLVFFIGVIVSMIFMKKPRTHSIYPISANQMVHTKTPAELMAEETKKAKEDFNKQYEDSIQKIEQDDAFIEITKEIESQILQAARRRKTNIELLFSRNKDARYKGSEEAILRILSECKKKNYSRIIYLAALRRYFTEKGYDATIDFKTIPDFMILKINWGTK